MQKSGIGVNVTFGYYPFPNAYLRSTLLREPVQVIIKTEFIGRSLPPGLTAEEEKTA
jgi:hypothetical protein